MKLVKNTTIKQIVMDTVIKPNAPTWTLVNTGAAICFIDDNFPLYPGDKLGDDSSTIAAHFMMKHPDLTVTTDLSFHLRFQTAGLTDAPEKYKSVQYIETTFRLEQ